MRRKLWHHKGMRVVVLQDCVGRSRDAISRTNETAQLKKGEVLIVEDEDDSVPFVYRASDTARRWRVCVHLSEIAPADPGIAALYGIDVKEDEA